MVRSIVGCIIVFSVLSAGCSKSKRFACDVTCQGGALSFDVYHSSEQKDDNDAETECKLAYEQPANRARACGSLAVASCDCHEESGGGGMMSPTGRDNGIGETAPSLSVRTDDGQSVSLPLDRTDRQTIVYVTAPECVWSQRNHANIAALAAARTGDYRFVVLSLDDPDIHTLRKSFDRGVEIYSADRSTALAALHVQGTPATVIISEQGVVEQHWRGAYGSTQRKRIETIFAVALPGWTTLPAPTVPGWFATLAGF